MLSVYSSLVLCMCMIEPNLTSCAITGYIDHWFMCWQRQCSYLECQCCSIYMYDFRRQDMVELYDQLYDFCIQTSSGQTKIYRGPMHFTNQESRHGLIVERRTNTCTHAHTHTHMHTHTCTHARAHTHTHIHTHACTHTHTHTQPHIISHQIYFSRQRSTISYLFWYDSAMTKLMIQWEKNNNWFLYDGVMRMLHVMTSQLLLLSHMVL